MRGALPLLLALAWTPAELSAQVLRRPVAAVPLNGPVDVDELLRLARVSQAINARTYLQYAFRQTTRLEELDAEGQVKRIETKVYRVIPSREGTIRHLLEQDGEPPSPRQLKKQQARNEKVRKRWEKIRTKQERANARRQAEREAAAPATSRPALPASGVAPTPPPAAPSGPARPATAGEPSATTPVSPPSPSPRAATRPAVRPPVAAGPVSAPAPARAEPAEDLSGLPTCSIADPLSSLRPPVPGSKVRSEVGIRRSAEEARKARNSTGDYTIFELLSLTNYEYLGACIYEDRPVHVVAFTPADDFDAQNPVERVVTAMEGTIFVDAADLQVMRTEGETVAPIKWGAGMVALRAAHVIFEGRKVNGEVWLPAADVFEFDTRVVFDRDRQRFTNYYDDYKKIVVSSTEEFVGVAEPADPPAAPPPEG